ncbi:acetoacetate--CoA ligase [Acidovorax sp. Be4]|uniref:Acetoacetate--CoA ligase n=1 Tax=Acidovorax bellezanensis TaxID=2976702 RepID=A0ABT2PNJ4_9BURK|nr:acetoacetate--CoA ligase [Acidovorax sp. Be4]MCT9811441.1 acetoacetate--CoA ligase [Acidovorax sp. Be4]
MSTLPAYIPQIRRYQDWLAQRHGLTFADYDALWRWSVTDLEAFWQSVWEFCDLQSPTPHTAVLARNVMPGAQWFPGAQVNFAQQVLRHTAAAAAAGMPAIISRNEQGRHREMDWPTLRRQVAALALHLQAQGVQPGDCVAAYLPNIPEAMVALLACVSIGAVWSICAPDMGTHAVLDRLRQIAPKVLIAVDGVHYAGRDIDRLGVLAELRAGLPSLQQVVLVNNLDLSIDLADTANWARIVARDDAATQAFEPLWLPFDHPLWIVYSSGTTGLPKPIVHGHGGMVLVALQLKSLHNDVGCSWDPNSWGERFHWYSSTGWVMWNAQVSGLLGGTTCVIFDGSPGGSKEQPDWGVLWRFAAETGVTCFGSGAAFYANCMKAGVDLSTCGDLSRVRSLGSTGSPLSAEVQAWGTAQFRALRAQAEARGRPGLPSAQDIWWNNISGGTDFCGAFLGGNRELPLVPGVMQCRQLGAAVEAWNEQGQPVTGAVGELVCTQPIPSMPLYLWGDDSGARYHSSYFDSFAPGHGRRPGGGDAGVEAGAVWRHGDWISIASDGGCVIYGRSDATINRHGLRMGTSEIYSAVEALPEVLDSLVVDLEYLGRESYMPLFVVLRPGLELDAALRARINGAIRSALSPRFVPDDIYQVAEVPRTLSGKKQELPIKKLLLGQPLDKVVNQDAMANPGCLAWYVALAQQRQAGLAVA